LPALINGITCRFNTVPGVRSAITVRLRVPLPRPAPRSQIARLRVAVGAEFNASRLADPPAVLHRVAREEEGFTAGPLQFARLFCGMSERPLNPANLPAVLAFIFGAIVIAVSMGSFLLTVLAVIGIHI
jgi:hypothetical protein